MSFPQEHYQRGLKKERATNKRFRRTIRMFKAARNKLVRKGVLAKEDAPSYFSECLLYNVPNELFAPKLGSTYTGILAWLETAKLKDFQSQCGQLPLFGPGREQWTGEEARAFVKALRNMWDTGSRP